MDFSKYIYGFVCMLGILSCPACRQDFSVSLSLLPPDAISSKVPLEVMGGVYNESDKQLEGCIAVSVAPAENPERKTVLDQSEAVVPANGTYAYSHTFDMTRYAGRQVIEFEFHADGQGVSATDTITVKDSERRSLSTIGGAWIGLYHWSEVEGKHWNRDIKNLTDADWRGVVRSMNEIGMNVIVLQELFRNQEYVGCHEMTAGTYPGKAFYPSELYPGRMPIACEDPVEAILSEASALGMKVFMGVGLYAWFDFSEESLEWHKAVTDELLERYGHHRAFYGLYVSEECVGSLDNCEATEELRQIRIDEIVTFFENYKRHCREVAPEKPVMLATNSMGVKDREKEYSMLLENLDILCPFGFARMPEGDLTGLEAAALLQKWCDEAGTHLWFDLEAFLFNDDTSLYPRDFEGIIVMLKK